MAHLAAPSRYETQVPGTKTRNVPAGSRPNSVVYAWPMSAQVRPLRHGTRETASELPGVCWVLTGNPAARQSRGSSRQPRAPRTRVSRFGYHDRGSRPRSSSGQRTSGGEGSSCTRSRYRARLLQPSLAVSRLHYRVKLGVACWSGLWLRSWVWFRRQVPCRSRRRWLAVRYSVVLQAFNER